jgi:hypothetical protein
MNGNFEKTKKVLAASLGTLMLVQGTAVAVGAAEIAPEAVVFTRPTVDNVSLEQIGANFVRVTVTVTGSENDEPIMAYFVDNKGNLKSVAYTGVRGSETQVLIGVPDSVDSGEYTVVVALNKAGETASAEIDYIGTGDVEGFFEALNSSTLSVEELVEALNNHAGAFSVVEYSADDSGKKLALDKTDYTSLSAAQKEAFAELIISAVNGKYSDLKGKFDSSNSESLLKEALVLAVYNSETVDSADADLTNYLYKFDSAIGFNSEDETLYGFIQDKETLAKIVKTMAPEVDSVEALAEAIAGAAGVELINETNWADIVNAVEKQNDLFQVSETQITALKKNKSLRTAFCKLMNQKFYSVEEIREAWDESYTQAKKSIESTSSSGGSGSSSSSSSDKKTSTIIAGGTYINSNDVLGTKKNITDYYTDMDDYAWASDYVIDLTEAGIVSGYGDKTFGPGNNLTRAEFMKMLVNACGLADLTAECSFTDVDKDAWYYVYIASAEKLGLASGYGNGLFGVNDAITREDAVTLIYRAAKIKNLPIQTFAVGTNFFTDKDQIASYAEEAVKGLYNAGLYLGTSDNSQLTTFEPKGYASRAFVAVVLDKIYNLK